MLTLNTKLTERDSLSNECCLGRDEGSSNWAILRELQFTLRVTFLHEAAIAGKVNDIKKLVSISHDGGCTCQQ